MKRHINTLLYSIFLTASCVASAPKTSTLIVNIVAEGLQDYNLQQIRPLLGNGGFSRLIGLDAAAVSAIDYGSQLDAVASTTLLMTGASPQVNGVPGAWVYNPEINQVSPIFKDAAYLGNFTDETLSAAGIKVSTITDELRAATDGKSQVYAVAADPQVSVALAGHAANGAFWIFDRTADWASSSYFNEMPQILTNRNYQSPLRDRLDDMEWTPLLELQAYPVLVKPAKPFAHTFPKRMAHRTAAFKASPLANTEVTDVAISLIQSAHLGSDNTPDIINIAYDLSPDGASEIETYDAYLRLDRDLIRLFTAAESAAGHGNVTIILTGIPAVSSSAPDDPALRIPAGEYSIKKALSLLNMYLIALHGNGDWVLGVYDRQFFLNHKLIADKNLSLTSMRQEVADFLARMAGVCDVYTVDDIIAARTGDNPQALKRNTSIEHTGDVIIDVLPGWTITDDPFSGISDRGVIRRSPQHYPAYFTGPGVAPKTIDHSIDARAVAPYIARLLHIRQPAASSVNTLN